MTRQTTAQRPIGGAARSGDGVLLTGASTTLVLSAAGMVGLASTNVATSGPDLVGIAAVISSAGGLVLGSISLAYAVRQRKPAPARQPDTVTIPAELLEHILSHERDDPPREEKR